MGKIFLSLEDEEFNRVFREFRYTSYRLETLQRYDVAYEREEYEQFLAGQPQDMAGITEWIDWTVARAVNSGKRMQRVHVVEEPISDYVRYEFACAYEHTASAGEDVRIIPVQTGVWPVGIPHYDYWLFVSSLLISMHYEQDGAFTAAEVIEDPGKIVQANYWRDLAVNRSIPYRSYISHRPATLGGSSPPSAV